MAKLMGLNHTIEYKKGSADALSRREGEATLTEIIVIQPMWVMEVAASYEGDAFAQSAILECTVGSQDVSFFHYFSRLRKIYVGVLE